MAVRLTYSPPRLAGWNRYIVTCCECTAEFETTNPGALRCHKCAKSHRQAYLREYRRRQGQGQVQQ
jgi:hypothetical protein